MWSSTDSQDVASKWVAFITGQAKDINYKSRSKVMVSTDRTKIYSFGTHFEMGRLLKDGSVLINGDTYSQSTTQHQSSLRAAVKGKVKAFIVPHAALAGARIEMDSVRCVHAQPARYIETEHKSANPPRHLQHVERMAYEVVPWSDEEIARWNEWHDWKEHVKEIEEQKGRLQYGIDEWDKAASAEHSEKVSTYWIKEMPRFYASIQRLVSSEPKNLGKPSGWQPGSHVHRPSPPDLLKAVGKIDGYVEREPRSEHRKAPWHVTGTVDMMTRVSGIKPDVEVHSPDEDGLWRWTTRRHVLGESVIRGDVKATRRVTCPSCRGAKHSVGAALPSLPTSWGVRAGAFVDDTTATVMLRSRVPVPTTGNLIRYRRWDNGGMDDRRNYLDGDGFENLDVIHYGALPMKKDAYPCSTCRGRGKVDKRYTRKGVYFLSGFDHNETHLAYFLSELPKGARPTTVDEAYDCLKPEAVSIAEADGREVKRQGDIFAIPTSYTTAQLKKKSKAGMQKMLGVLRTNHACTNVIVTDDGLTFGRGIMHHVPDGRSNDHKRVALGKEWHVLMTNLAPRR